MEYIANLEKRAQETWNLDHGIFPTTEAEKAEPKKYKKKSYTGNDYLVYILTKGVIMKKTYREVFNDKTTLYIFLKANIVRGRMRHDPLDIYDKQYDKGFLACSFTLKFLEKQCNLTNYKVRKYIKELKEAGIIRVEKDQIKGSNSSNRSLIFILGTHQFIDGKTSERFYFEDIMDKEVN